MQYGAPHSRNEQEAFGMDCCKKHTDFSIQRATLHYPACLPRSMPFKACFQIISTSIERIMSDDPITRLQKIEAALSAGYRKYRVSRTDLPTIIIVSKTIGIETLRPLLNAGYHIFGENRIQEAKAKWPALKKEFRGVELHLIGPVQTNKVREAVALFDVIQTLDRPKLAAALAAEMRKQERMLSCFIQVNTGEEPQKSGILPSETDRFIKACREEYGLKIIGLMCIPPVNEEPSLHFGLLKAIADRNSLTQLSMGMSGDYEIAACMGATHVRIGTAIFGERHAQT